MLCICCILRSKYHFSQHGSWGQPPHIGCLHGNIAIRKQIILTKRVPQNHCLHLRWPRHQSHLRGHYWIKRIQSVIEIRSLKLTDISCKNPSDNLCSPANALPLLIIYLLECTRFKDWQLHGLLRTPETSHITGMLVNFSFLHYSFQSKHYK